MKKITVLSIGMILGGLLLVGASFVYVKGDITMFNSKNNRFIEKSYECAEDVKDLTIQESSSTIVLQTGDVDRATVTYSDKEEETLYDIEESDGELKITRKKYEGFSFFNFDFSDHKMIVTVPESFHGGVNISSSSGSVKVYDVTGEDIMVKNTSGSVKVCNVTGEDISIQNTSGSIKLEDVTGRQDIAVKNTSGSISLTNTEAGENIKAENTSGGIRLERLKSGKDISLSAVSGSIKGTIDGKQSDYRIRAEVTSGSCNLENSDEGDRELNVHATSGSIKIEFLD